MKCLVCNNEVEGSFCPVCGFHTVVVLGATENDPMILEAARTYRLNILEKSVIELETYEYKLKDGVPALENIDRIRISGTARQLEKGQIAWFSEEFARIEAGEDLKLTLYITYDGRVRKKEINLKAPDISSLWKVGIKAAEGLDFAVILGTENNYIETERFCILD